VQTPPGQANIVTLPDGSKVWMNGDSRISFNKDFTSTDRNVEFEGEGYFEITKDTLKEFNVITKGMIVQVHGTSFNLEAFSGEDIITTLVEGKVALQTPSGDMISYLKPGQQSVVQANGKSALITEVDTEQYTSWKNGYISFKNQSIGEIVPRLERLYNIDIIIQNERVNKICVSGKALKYSPVDHLFKAFELTYGIHYKLDVSIDKKSRLYIY
jgi:ferric-dicitrate binding protein FerR (iron transport regulator)